jgi:hypothetical protein
MKGWNLFRNQSAFPPFKKFEIDLLPRGLQAQMSSPFFYTPLIQLKVPSEEFGASMRYLQRKKTINDQDNINMTETIVAEYVGIHTREMQAKGIKDSKVDTQNNP